MNRMLCLFFFVLLATFHVQASAVTVTDLAGRQVTVNAPVSRIILADSRMLLVMSLLHPQDPLKGIVVWDDSLQTRAPDMGRYFAQYYPQLKQIPVFANPYRSDFSVENALSMRPDLIVFDIGILTKLRDSGSLGLLEKSHIPVIFVDLRQKPLVNTPASIRLLAEVTGQRKNADRFLARWHFLLQRVEQRVKDIPASAKPGVVFENHAGMTGDTCCAVFGRDSFGQFISAAGGENMMAGIVPPHGGDVSAELLLSRQPDYYLLSGANWGEWSSTSLAVPPGYDADRATAMHRLQRLLSRNGISALASVREKKVMAIYHQFYDSPFNVIALEAMAKLFYPELFADIDPVSDLKAMYQDFTGIPYRGLFPLQPE